MKYKDGDNINEMTTMLIYAQEHEHGESFIIADKKALQALKEAIAQALEHNIGRCKSFNCDGEGYDTIIIYEEDGNDVLNLIPVYTDPPLFKGMHPFDAYFEYEPK